MSSAITCRFEPAMREAWASVASPAAARPEPVDSTAYYQEYHGHQPMHLATVRSLLARAGVERFVYFIGDSTLDNKHWFFAPSSYRAQISQSAIAAKAVNGYEEALDPPRMVKDVCYWMNRGLAERVGPKRVACMMTSIEESTIEDRSDGLLAQDEFVREHIGAEDFLVVSVGGNDVALRPTARTSVNMLMLTRMPNWMITARVAPGFGYFVKLFHNRIENLVKQVVSQQKPKKILICMIYHLDEQPGGWADRVLNILGYDSNPSKLQLIIKTLFDAIKAKGFNIPGTEVIPFPLFEVLDGKNTEDYIQRVEPSISGGRKMAEAFLDTLLPETATRGPVTRSKSRTENKK